MISTSLYSELIRFMRSDKYKRMPKLCSIISTFYHDYLKIFHIMLLEIWTVLLSFFIHTYSTERGMNYWNKDKKLQSQTRKVFFSKVTFIDFKKLILSFAWKSHGWVKVRRTQHLPLPHLPLSNHAHAIMKLLMEYRF